MRPHRATLLRSSSFGLRIRKPGLPMPAAEWFEFSSFSPSAGIRSQIQEIRQIRRACEAMAVRAAALRGLAVRSCGGCRRRFSLARWCARVAVIYSSGYLPCCGEKTSQCEAHHLACFSGVTNATASLLKIATSFQGPYGPATSFHASLVPPLADWLSAAL